MIILKSPEEIRKMGESNAVVAEMLTGLAVAVSRISVSVSQADKGNRRISVQGDLETGL